MDDGQRHVVIVGGSGDLGRAAVEEHLKRGWRVTATARDLGALEDLWSANLNKERSRSSPFTSLTILRWQWSRSLSGDRDKAMMPVQNYPV